MYTPIICLSASRWIGITGQQDDVPSVTRIGERNVGFEYIPGAGDDDELWAKVRFIFYVDNRGMY
jgi:tRNA A64-2'-O-ribosylphosphate transferase